MNINKNTYSLSAQTAYVFISKSVSYCIGILAPIILVRIFSKESYGIYQQMLFISILFLEISKWGLINSLYYYYPVEKEKRTQILTQTFLLMIVIGLIVMLLLYSLRYLIADLFSVPLIVKFITPMCLYFFFMLTSLILDSLFILEKKSRLVIIYEITRSMLLGLTLIGAAIVYKDVYYILWFLTIFAFVKFMFLYIYLRKNYNISVNKLELRLIKSQLKYAFPIGCARLVGEIGRKIDKLILAIFLSPAHFAFYSIAHLGVPFIAMFNLSISQVTIPEMSIKKKEGNFTEIIKLWHDMIVKSSIIAIPIIVFLLLQAENLIIIVFTDRYFESAKIFKIILLITPFHLLHSSVVLRSYKKTKIMFISQLFSAIVAVILGLILIKHYGMIGAAVCFVLSSLVRTLIQIGNVKNLLLLSFRRLLPWYNMLKIILFSLIAATFMLSVSRLESNHMISFLYESIGYFLIILLMYLKLKILDFGNR